MNQISQCKFGLLPNSQDFKKMTENGVYKENAYDQEIRQYLGRMKKLYNCFPIKNFILTSI